ncbi:nuclear transport factor 2 family protein [Pseudonocardia cypriaca]|uniref:Ketosteroid isomerase-like protein n=1 Tax=Pseudonocardia cypriaca TaxID=882449 RepID=A0A543GCS6_9PSEU|nr:nuclear transport factor 2 family protein [Pseudonocardia cypriaca]TQM43858.1 ketosteroid isomerase-like protein [Pseudonocardia cypriaca]
MTVDSATGAETWIRRYYQLCGAKDIDGAMEFWAPDGKLTFANFEPVIGRDAIHETLAQIVHNWIKETHSLHHFWLLADDLVAFEMDVAFDRHDGRHVVVPGAAVCRIDDRRFLEQRIYVDMTPVFAPSDAAASATA